MMQNRSGWSDFGRRVVFWATLGVAVVLPGIVRAEDIYATKFKDLADIQAKATAGDRNAEAQLGAVYLIGRDAPVDAVKAIQWLTAAADHGSLYATSMLAQAYRYGRSVPPDPVKARVWFKRLAEMGDAYGETNYGLMLSKGTGGPQNQTEAVTWFQKAAEQGEEGAEMLLALAYLEGRGIAKDPARAVALFRKAADQGDYFAMAALGGASAAGAGMPKSLIAGYAWFALAHERSESMDKAELAKAMRDLAKGLSKEDIARAKEAAKAWHPGIDMAALVDPAAAAPAAGGPVAGEKPSAGAPARRGGGTGTGFVVGDKGEVLTNAHVAGDCATITLHLAGGVSAPATALAVDRENDLALLSPALGTLPRLTFRDGLPRAGEGVVSVGFPLGSMLATDGNVTTGNVTALAGFRNDPRMLQTTAPVQPGNSGGPLVDLSGNVIGVVSSELIPFKVTKGVAVSPQNVNFAIKAEIVRVFLDQYKVSYATTASGSNLNAADIAERVKKSTVVVECRR